jgi:indole-3-glycerol phosphate synthase
MSAALPTILERILETKREEVAQGRKTQPLSFLKDEIQAREELLDQRSFAEAITSRIQAQQSAVIAEIKKASPSKGILRDPFQPIEIAQAYESAGAACLSVLTDRQYFQGHPDYLKAARQACSLPVLRKDFIVNPYQIWESCAMGADAILLIAASLARSQMQDFEALAMELGLSVLVEVHNCEEWESALTLQTPLLGVNNRNLHDFSVSLSTTLDLCAECPASRYVISESGILTKDDVNVLKAAQVHGFLVGEAFMRAVDPAQALRALFF